MVGFLPFSLTPAPRPRSSFLPVELWTCLQSAPGPRAGRSEEADGSWRSWDRGRFLRGSCEGPEGTSLFVDMFLTYLGSHCSVFQTSLMVPVYYTAHVTPSPRFVFLLYFPFFLKKIFSIG